MNLYIELDKMDEAISSVQKAAEQDASPSNYFNLGVLYEKKGDEDKAVESYKKVLIWKKTLMRCITWVPFTLIKALKSKKKPTICPWMSITSAVRKLKTTPK
ncbi:MAG: hypothetical protein HC880_16880 [Bacteroidia bacterium]|nr:hypothetical protein [Bacteroidia bacterium]